MEIWKTNRQLRMIDAGTTLRIQAQAPFMLHWSTEEWRQPIDTRSQTTALGIDFVDIEVARNARAPVRFTFLWVQSKRWEGRDYVVEIRTPD
jgi:glucoamylase